MNDLLKHILIVIVPLVVSNSVHMVLVKKNFFHAVNAPIWNRGFGKNKTWRGLLFVPVANSLMLTLLAGAASLDIAAPAALGFVLGFAYMLFELPNSFMKRRLGIAAGENHGKYRIVFSVIDKMDSAIGVVLAYMLMGYTSWDVALVLLLVAIVTHMAVSGLLVILRLKSSF